MALCVDAKTHWPRRVLELFPRRSLTESEAKVAQCCIIVVLGEAVRETRETDRWGTGCSVLRNSRQTWASESSLTTPMWFGRRTSRSAFLQSC